MSGPEEAGEGTSRQSNQGSPRDEPAQAGAVMGGAGTVGHAW